MEKLLKARKELKRKKPEFIRQDAHKKPRVRRKWRRPKGLHSKMRLRKKGYRAVVKKGWRSPKLVRGLSREGLEIIMINNIKEADRIIKDKQGVLINKKVGKRKKIEIIKWCKEKRIKVLNFKDAEQYMKKIEEETKKREEKKKKAEEKKEKKKKAVKKKEEKDELTEKVEKESEKTEKEKKEREKKEKDKLLIKRETK